MSWALREGGKMSDITFGLMDNKLDELAHVLGGCERLASTPVPFAYTLILQRTVYLFCTLLPFALVGDLHYMTPFVGLYLLHLLVVGFAGGRAGRSVRHRSQRFAAERDVQHHRAQPAGYDRAASAAGEAAPDRYYNLT
jgi:hypothetical protein